MYRGEMLYIHFTWHRLIPERLFLPPRGPVCPGLARMFWLLPCVLWPGLSIPRLRIVSCLCVACLTVCRVLRDHTVSCSVWPGLVVRSGSCVPGVRRVHGLVVIILPYNTKHYYYGRTRYWCTDWHGLRRWPLVRVGRVTSGQGSGSGATPAWRSPIHPGSYLLYVLNTITLW